MYNEGYLNEEVHHDKDENDRSYTVELEKQSKISIYYRKLCSVLEPFSLWHSSLKEIEYSCGCGVLSYFKFISWIFKINLSMLVLQLSILVIPFMSFKPQTFNELISSDDRNNSVNMFSLAKYCTQEAVVPQPKIAVKLILDILEGHGPLENSPLFIGYYFNKSYFNTSSNKFVKAVFNTPVAYSFAFWMCIVTSFIITIYGSAINYKTFIMDDKIQNKLGFSLLTGFDYGITRKTKITSLKHDLTRKIKFQYEQLKLEQRRSLLTKNQLLFIYLKRIIINLLFVAFLLLIYFIIVLAQGVPLQLSKEPFVQSSPILTMLKDYVPSVTVAMINIIFQFVNQKVIVFEQYSATYAVGVSLKRVILIQAISLLIFMVTVLDQINQTDIRDNICHQTELIKCWETYVGQQFYRLSILGFITMVIVSPLIQIFRIITYKKFHENSKIVKLIGLPEFDLSLESFLLINSQCVCWMGFWFCPFLIVIMVVQLFLLFYIRKSMFMRNNLGTTVETLSVAGGQRFMLEMLLFSLAFILLPVGYILSNKTPSRGCSPFRIYGTSDSKYSFTKFLTDYITSLSPFMDTFWNELISIKVISTILVLIILVTYVKYAQSKAYSKYIATLRSDIVKEEKTHLFYKEQINHITEVISLRERLSSAGRRQ